jgi:hypothetical protein
MPSTFSQLKFQMKKARTEIRDREELRDWCLFFQGELLFKKHHQSAWGMVGLSLALATLISFWATLILEKSWGWFLTFSLLVATFSVGYYLLLCQRSLQELEQAYHGLWQTLQREHKANWLKLAELIFAFVTDLLAGHFKLAGGSA